MPSAFNHINAADCQRSQKKDAMVKRHTVLFTFLFIFYRLLNLLRRIRLSSLSSAASASGFLFFFLRQQNVQHDGEQGRRHDAGTAEDQADELRGLA